MGFLKKLFKKKNNENKYNVQIENKYNIKTEQNQPRMVYGVPDPSEYDIYQTRNRLQEKNDSFNSSDSDNLNKEDKIKNKCNEIMGPDPFWVDLLEKYMYALNVSEEQKLEYLNKLAIDQDISNEFSKYLLRNSFDIPNAIEVNGKTAKMISNENPELTAIEVYIKLIEEKRNINM